MPSRHRWPWEAQGVSAARKAHQARQAHHTSRWLTIFLPLLVGGLLAAGAAAGVVFAAGPTAVSHGAAIVVILASAACLVGMLPLLALLVGLVVLTARAQRRTPEVSLQVLQAIEQTHRNIVRVLDKAALPIIRIQATQAAWRAVWHAIHKGGQA